MKKKLIWKFNIVDILVILVIAAVAVFFATKFLKSSGVVSSAAKPGTITYVVEVPGMSKELYDEVTSFVPCQMAASGEWVDGYIREATCVACDLAYIEASSPVNSNQTQWVIPNAATQYVTAYFTCEASVDLNDMFNMVGTQEIRVGRNHYLKSVDIELIGSIISMEKSAG